MSNTRYATLPHVGLTDVYPVGVLRALQIAGRSLTAAGIPHRERLPSARSALRKEARYLRHQIGKRNWRAVRNSFNGYLAEPYTFPGYMRRCGHGWTTKRAIRDLMRHEAATRPAKTDPTSEDLAARSGREGEQGEPDA